MRQSWLWLWMAVIVPVSLPAQEQAKPSAGHGYVFAGFGAVNAEDATFHFGGGGEGYLFRGLGVGFELGYLAPFQYLGEGIGVLSVNGLYDFGRTRSKKVSPFVTAGYSLAFREGTANALNFGGGIHYWFARRFGLRVEFRDHFSPDTWNEHFWQGRLAIEFR